MQGKSISQSAYFCLSRSFFYRLGPTFPLIHHSFFPPILSFAFLILRQVIYKADLIGVYLTFIKELYSNQVFIIDSIRAGDEDYEEDKHDEAEEGSSKAIDASK